MSFDFDNTSAVSILDNLARVLSENFAKKHGAQISVAADPAHALDLLGGVRAGAAAIVLFYLGDVPAGEEELAGDTLVEGTIRVAVVQHPGLAAKPAKTAPNALRLAEALRTEITGLSMSGVLGGFSYAGMTHLENYSGEILHGYALSYKAGYAFDIN